MQAVVLKNGALHCQDIAKPLAAAGEALIHLRLAGICATDLELVKGYAGFTGVLGHEFVGEVVAVDKPHQHWLHQRVVGSINLGCRQCLVCLNDGPEHCPNRKVLGIRGQQGVFADYFTLPVTNLYAVPDSITDETAVFAEPLAAALRVVKQLQAVSVANIAVIGPGRLGLLIAKVLAVAGYQVQVLGRSAKSLVLPKQWQLNTDLIDKVADNQFDCVVDASGQADGFRQALRIIRPRGILILKSTFAAAEPVDLSKIVVAELQVMGSRCGSFADALALMTQQVIPFETLIDARYALCDGEAALAFASRPGVRKVLLRP
ncbi:MAG: Zn-dependent alcohol dehydrogenase [Methylomonas sp.]|nr:MAG: Zn-dependent alcohol dehydrogenase [Methylomonas sp.]